MAKDFKSFVEESLDYLEGKTTHLPSIASLSPAEREQAEQWLERRQVKLAQARVIAEVMRLLDNEPCAMSELVSGIDTSEFYVHYAVKVLLDSNIIIKHDDLYYLILDDEEIDD
jgi:hypothetical protein